MDSMRALIIDDEVDFLETVVKRLRKRQFEAEGVASGEEGLELLKRKPFDVIVLDIKMPRGMDGIEALKEIKKIRPEIQVILLTGHASVETSIEGMKYGAFDYLIKPVKFEELLIKMGAAFEQKKLLDTRSPV
ncbi:MAG: response regulator [Thermodesulfobacteriota bacterium]